MSPIIQDQQRRIVFALALVMLSLPVAAEQVTLQGGTILRTPGTNISYQMMQQVEVDAVTVSETAVAFGTVNMSLTANDTARLHAGIWTVNLSRETDDATVFQVAVNASAGQNASFRLANITAPGNGEYVLSYDGTSVRQFPTGGTLRWHWTNWTTSSNFTLWYNASADTTEAGDETDSTSVSPGTSTDDTDTTTGTPSNGTANASAAAEPIAFNVSTVTVNRSPLENRTIAIGLTNPGAPWTVTAALTGNLSTIANLGWNHRPFSAGVTATLPVTIRPPRATDDRRYTGTLTATAGNTTATLPIFVTTTPLGPVTATITTVNGTTGSYTVQLASPTARNLPIIRTTTVTGNGVHVRTVTHETISGPTTITGRLNRSLPAGRYTLNVTVTANGQTTATVEPFAVPPSDETTDTRQDASVPPSLLVLAFLLAALVAVAIRRQSQLHGQKREVPDTSAEPFSPPHTAMQSPVWDEVARLLDRAATVIKAEADTAVDLSAERAALIAGRQALAHHDFAAMSDALGDLHHLMVADEADMLLDRVERELIREQATGQSVTEKQDALRRARKAVTRDDFSALARALGDLHYLFIRNDITELLDELDADLAAISLPEHEQEDIERWINMARHHLVANELPAVADCLDHLASNEFSEIES